jgi:sarcosine oxidase subunit gamma
VTASIERLSPLAAWTARFARASAEAQAFAIRELAFTTQVNLRGEAADARFAQGVQAALGCGLPSGANTFAAAGERRVTWLGPNVWLVTDGPDQGDAICQALRRELAGVHVSVTDVSAARTVIEIAGREARVALAKGCPLDVHASAFAPPRTAQTLLAKARVLIQCVDATPTFRIFVLDSFAPYLAEWLTDAAAECAASRALDCGRIAERLSQE